jgi:hypothetical protein
VSRLSLVRYALAFALFAVTVPATPAHAFVCLRINGNGPCARWLQGSTTARSFLGTPSSPLINGTVTWDQNAINAANDWNAAGGAFGFNVTTGGTFINPCGPAGAGHVCPNTGPGGDNPVFFADSFCGQGFGDIIELTNNCADINSGGMLNAPVFVNSAVSWNAYDGPLRTANNRVIHDIRRVLVHELGHVLGLDHPDDNGQSVSAIMNSRESNIDRLQQDDIDGLFSLYPNGGLPPGRGDASGCTIANRGTPTNAWMLLAPAVLALLRLRRRPRWSASG